MPAPNAEPPKRIEVAQRRQRAIELRRTGHTYQQIADELGYSNRGSAHRDIARAVADARADLAKDANEYRKEQTRELEAMQAVAWEALSSLGVHVSNTGDGDVITTEIDDPELALKGLDRLVKIQARIAALNGLDAPAKVDTTSKVTYSIDGVDMDKLT